MGGYPAGGRDTGRPDFLHVERYVWLIGEIEGAGGAGSIHIVDSVSIDPVVIDTENSDGLEADTPLAQRSRDSIAGRKIDMQASA
jgi:hypothetical protein